MHTQCVYMYADPCTHTYSSVDGAGSGFSARYTCRAIDLSKPFSRTSAELVPRFDDAAAPRVRTIIERYVETLALMREANVQQDEKGTNGRMN